MPAKYIFKSPLTEAQREDVIDAMISQSGGHVRYGQKYTDMKYVMRNGTEFSFRGGEDVYKLAERLSFDWEKEDAGVTMTGGIAAMQVRQRAGGALMVALQNASRNEHGYNNLGKDFVDGLVENGLHVGAPEPEKFFEMLIDDPTTRKALESTFAYRYDAGKSIPLITSLMANMDMLGIYIYDPSLSPRVAQSVSEERRTDLGNKHRVVDFSGGQGLIQSRARDWAKSGQPMRAFVKHIHRLSCARNMALSEKGEVSASPAEFLSPSATKLLAKAYVSAISGDEKSLSDAVSSLQSHERTMYVASYEPEKIEDFVNHRSTLSKIHLDMLCEMRAKSNPEAGEMVSELRASQKLPAESGIGATISLLKASAAWGSKSLYQSGEDKFKARIGDVSGRISTLFKKHEQGAGYQKSVHDAEALLNQTSERFKRVLNTIRESEPDMAATLQSVVSDLISPPLPVGMPTDKVAEHVKSVEQRFLTSLSSPAEKLFNKYYDSNIEGLRELAKDDSTWQAALPMIEARLSVANDESVVIGKRMDATVTAYLASCILEYYATSVRPEMEAPAQEAVEQKNVGIDTVGAPRTEGGDTAGNSPINSPDVVESIEEGDYPVVVGRATEAVEATPGVKDEAVSDVESPVPEKETELTEPKSQVETPLPTQTPVDVTSENAEQSEPEGSSIDTVPDVKPDKDIAAARAELVRIEDRIIELAFKNDELVAPDAMEWFSSRWKDIVGDVTSVSEQSVLALLDEAKVSFGPLVYARRTKELKDWFEVSFEKNLHKERIEKSMGIIVSALSGFDDTVSTPALTHVKNFMGCVTDDTNTVPEYADLDRLKEKTVQLESVASLFSQSDEKGVSAWSEGMTLRKAAAEKWSVMVRENPDSSAQINTQWNAIWSVVNVTDPSQLKLAATSAMEFVENKEAVSMMMASIPDVGADDLNKVMSECEGYRLSVDVNDVGVPDYEESPHTDDAGLHTKMKRA
tara:strand:- start:31409 stop:34336 length:2928 start_codon:yes stop_codon:yes gene_type:complete